MQHEPAVVAKGEKVEPEEGVTRGLSDCGVWGSWTSVRPGVAWWLVVTGAEMKQSSEQGEDGFVSDKLTLKLVCDTPKKSHPLSWGHGSGAVVRVEMGIDSGVTTEVGGVSQLLQVPVTLVYD